MVGMAERKKKRRPGPRIDPDSKRSAGGDRHTKPRKAFHAPAELFAALDRYIEETRPQPTDSSVLREALERYLTDKGYWPPKT